MFLSFIIPIYNAEQYLEECLKSLLNQDIPYSEYEIICVNDGSSDKSSILLRNYSIRYNNIHVINKENAGVSAARNDGLAEAKADYVWFVDADDFISTNILNKLYFEVKEINIINKIDIIQFGAYSFMDKLLPEERKLYNNHKILPQTYANNVFVTRNIFRKNFLKHHNIKFYTELNYSEDKMFVSEVLAKDPCIMIIEDTFYFYRYHNGSAITKEVNIEEKFFSILQFQKIYKDAFPKYKSLIADNLMSEIYNCLYIVSGLPHKQYKEIKDKLKEQGILKIKRPKECTLKESYLIPNLGIVGKIFNYIFIHLDSALGRKMMRCIRILNEKLKK